MKKKREKGESVLNLLKFVFEVQEKAESVLKENAILCVPIPIDGIAMNYGLQIFMYDFDNSNVSGFLKPKEKSVYINRKNSIHRRRFTLARQLGNFLMRHDFPTEYIERRSPIFGKKSWYDRGLDAFSAHLLVPFNFLRKEECIFTGKKDFSYEDIDDLSKKYDVSMDIIGYQIKRLNLSK